MFIDANPYKSILYKFDGEQGQILTPSFPEGVTTFIGETVSGVSIRIHAKLMLFLSVCH